MNRLQFHLLFHLLLGSLTAALMLSVARADVPDDAPADIHTPLIVISSEAPPLTAAEISAVTTGLEIPPLTPDEVTKRLGLVPPPSQKAATAIEAAATEGEELFFSGALEAALHFFNDVADAATAHRSLPAFYPKVRHLTFKSHLYAAQIADKLEGRDAAIPHIRQAAAMENMSPSAEEFPPWVLEMFDHEKKSNPRPLGTLSLFAPAGCRLYKDGLDLGAGPTFNGVFAGESYVKVRCEKMESPVTLLTVEKESVTELTPLLLKTGAISATHHTAILQTTVDAVNPALLSDVAAIGIALRAPRMAVLLAQKKQIVVWIFDCAEHRILKEVRLSRRTPSALAAGAYTILTDTQSPTSPPLSTPRRKWYQDIAGWTTSGIGLAVLGAGAALHITAKKDSLQLPISYSLYAAGAGLFGSGIILLVLPAVSVNNDLHTHRPSVAFSMIGRF